MSYEGRISIVKFLYEGIERQRIPRDAPTSVSVEFQDLPLNTRPGRACTSARGVNVGGLIGGGNGGFNDV